MFTKNKDGASAQSYVPPADASKSAASRTGARSTGVASIICNDMEIKGSINSEGALHIDGVVDGDVTAGDITIGATGKVIGEVKGEAVKVKGEVLGSIRGRRVELETGARVEGDILHASLSIQPNAIFEGQVKHAEDPLKTSAPKAARPASGDTASSTAKPAATDSKSASTSASGAHGSALS